MLVASIKQKLEDGETEKDGNQSYIEQSYSVVCGWD